MNKQKEIKEEIDKILYERIGDDEGVICAEILAYLHSQGCVIKVDKELPRNPEISPLAENIYRNAQQSILKAGYAAVEPLVDKDTK